MFDQFGSNQNSLEYALTGQNEQELMENYQMDVPKMNFSTTQADTETQSSTVSPITSPTVSSICNYAQKSVTSQQNVLVNLNLFGPCVIYF